MTTDVSDGRSAALRAGLVERLRAEGWVSSPDVEQAVLTVPRELFAMERLHLKPLPAWIPEVYRLHQRLTDRDHRETTRRSKRET